MQVGKGRVCLALGVGQSSIGGGSGVSERDLALCKKRQQENLSSARGCRECLKAEVPSLDCELLPKISSQVQSLGCHNTEGK